MPEYTESACRTVLRDGKPLNTEKVIVQLNRYERVIRKLKKDLLKVGGEPRL